MKRFNQLRYNNKTINYMTNNFTFNNFFQTNHEMGVIIITPKQVAISYRKMEKDVTHDDIIKNMLRVFNIKNKNPIVAISCYSYSDKNGGCLPDIIRNREITKEMYEVIDKIYQKVIGISSKIDSATAKEFIEMYNLKIDNSDMEDEKIVGIHLDDFMRRLDEIDLETKELPTLFLGLLSWTIEKTIQDIKGRIIKKRSKEEKTKKICMENKLDKYKIKISHNQIEQKAIQQQEELEEQKIDDNQMDIS
ncbi:MAG: hypothetical protein HFJ59_03655 [Clostridia bacterium]|nr:hypothetical protein [Clostridia bacterium]